MKAQPRQYQHRWLLPLVIAVNFFLDGSLSLAFSNLFYDNNLQMAPQLILLSVVMCTFAFPESKMLFWYALVAGLAYDLFYTGLIGQYMLIVPLTYLITKSLMNYFLPSAIYELGADIICVLVGQLILYFLAHFFGMTQAGVGQFISNALAPTIILNVLLFLIFYWPNKWALHFIHRNHGR